MSIAGRGTDQLVQIVSAGGGLIINVTNRSTDQLVQIASAASVGRARVVFSGIGGRSTDQLVQIGAAGKGYVQFAE